MGFFLLDGSPINSTQASYTTYIPGIYDGWWCFFFTIRSSNSNRQHCLCRRRQVNKLSYRGATFLQGPHHEAVKSTCGEGTTYRANENKKTKVLQSTIRDDVFQLFIKFGSADHSCPIKLFGQRLPCKDPSLLLHVYYGSQKIVAQDLLPIPKREITDTRYQGTDTTPVLQYCSTSISTRDRRRRLT